MLMGFMTFVVYEAFALVIKSLNILIRLFGGNPNLFLDAIVA